MMNTSAALKFLLDVLFDTYAFVVLARFILQLVRADFYNPMSQFTIKVTNPLLVPLRRIIPGIGGIDLASVVLLLAIELTKIILLSFILAGALPDPLTLTLGTLLATISLVISFFTYAIFMQVIISWVSQGYSPAAQILHQMTEPLLKPARRLIPPMGGLDLSPMLVLLLLSFVRILLGI